MRKYVNFIFIAIVVIAIAAFAYTKLQDKAEETKKANMIKAVTKSTEKISNTAQDTTLTSQEVKNFEVGRDIHAGYYDVSTDSDCQIFLGSIFVTVSKDNPASNMLLADGDVVTLNAAGTAEFTKSALKALEIVHYNGKEVYEVLNQGLYFSDSQIPAGKYKLLYENLPKADVKSKLNSDIAISTAGLDFGESGSVPLKNVNRSASKQLEPSFTLDKEQILGISYINPPKDLRVYLEKIG
ncbi:hypothetical protein OfM1_09130 [Lactovum odontotermitis]